MKIKKIFALAPMFFALNASAMAESEDIIFKIRGSFAYTNAKQTGLPPATSVAGKRSPESPGKLIAGAYGAEGSATMFLTNHVAGEFGSGLTVYRGKSTATKAINYNYSNNIQNLKKRNLYTIPAYLTMQYHIAPYGAIRPYVGAGYHYTYMIPRTTEFKVKNGSGFVVQGGVDFAFKDDTYINLDVKQYLLKTTVRYNRVITGASRGQISSKITMNPIVIGLGLGFKL